MLTLCTKYYSNARVDDFGTDKLNLKKHLSGLFGSGVSPISHLVRSAATAAPRLQQILNHVIG